MLYRIREFKFMMVAVRVAETSICKRQQEYPRNGVSYRTLKVHPVCATPPPRLDF